MFLVQCVCNILLTSNVPFKVFRLCLFRRKHIQWRVSLTRFPRSVNSQNITCFRERKWRSNCPSSSIRSVSDSSICIYSQTQTNTSSDIRHLSSGVGAMTWSPLACGIISGKYDSGVPPYSRASLKVPRSPRKPLRPSSSSYVVPFVPLVF